MGREVDGPDPRQGATTRLELTDDDLRRIMTAVRDGLAPVRPAGPKGGQVLRSWVAPLTGFAILLTGWLVLTHWRPVIDPRVQASTLPESEILQFSPRNENVSWNVDNARVQTLTVSGFHSIGVLVDLPIPATTVQCLRLARELDGDCSTTTNTVLVTSPVTVSWSSPQPLTLRPAGVAPASGAAPTAPAAPQQSRASSLRLTVVSPQPPVEDSGTPAEQPAVPAAPATPAAQPASELSIWANTGVQDSPAWCLGYAPTAQATLSIVARKTSVPRVFTSDRSPNIQCTGLKLSVLPGLTPGQMGDDTDPVPAVVTLSGIAGLRARVESTDVSISGLTGKIVLEEDRTKVFDMPVAASIHALDRIAITLDFQTGRPSLSMSATRVANIDTGEGNLVRTAWQRQKELALPIFLGLVGLMTPLLGAAYRNTFDYLIGQPRLLQRNMFRVARWIWWPFAAIGRLLYAPVRWLRRPRGPARHRQPPDVPPKEA